MRPLADWPMEQRRGLTGVLTDIDDTLTTDGAITTDALEALEALKEAGLHVIAITGRPVGWSEPFARTWPVDAIVAENGAVALVNAGHSTAVGPDATKETETELRRLYLKAPAIRASNFARLQQVAQRILREVPGALLSRDSPGRETDIAIDHSEFTQLPREKIAHVVRIMELEGMTATVSSIHINGWFGEHNKLVGANWIVWELLKQDLAANMHRWVYVGDSTNDQLMFEAFPYSVGVANIRRFENELTHLPKYIAQRERGAGFAEITASIISAHFK